jgi:hypothetical protein
VNIKTRIAAGTTAVAMVSIPCSAVTPASSAPSPPPARALAAAQSGAILPVTAHLTVEPSPDR